MDGMVISCFVQMSLAFNQKFLNKKIIMDIGRSGKTKENKNIEEAAKIVFFGEGMVCEC